MDVFAAVGEQDVPTVTHGGPENLFGMGPVIAEADHAHASMPTGAWLRGPGGRPSSAGLGVLVDDVLGQAVLTERLPGRWSVTTELSVDVAAPLPVDGQVVSATGAPLQVDDGGGLARGQVRDASGRCLAVATSWHRFTARTPPAVLHPPQLPDGVVRGGDLADLLVVGIEGTGGFCLPSRPELNNPQGVAHGGILLCLAVMTAERAFLGRGLDVASARVAYVRPAAGDLSFEPMIIHSGQSLGVLRIAVLNASRALCADATVTLRSPVGPEQALEPVDPK